MSKKKQLCTFCGYSDISCRCGKPKKAISTNQDIEFLKERAERELKNE